MSYERQYYLDKVRHMAILLVFPLHTLMVWNNFGSKWYVWGGENNLLSSLTILVNPWIMPILFAIAGICARYSLEKRGEKKFIHERFTKLMIPFISSLILLIPIQTFVTRKFFFHYEGSYLEHIGYFFTHITDFTGYDGCFTPAHLWFILFLLVISLLGLLIAKIVTFQEMNKWVRKMPLVLIIGMFFLVWAMYYVGNIGGFSIGKNLILFLLGYYVLSNDTVMKKLEKYNCILFPIFIGLTILLSVLFYFYFYYGDFFVNFMSWFAIITILPFAKLHCNKKTRFLDYLNQASFPIYLLHQTILVVLSYFVITYVEGVLLQVMIIMIGSFVLTIAAYELIKRIPYVRSLFGIKYRKIKVIS